MLLQAAAWPIDCIKNAWTVISVRSRGECALVSDGTSGSGQILVIFSGSASGKTCLQPESIFLNNSYFSCSLINRAKVRYDRAFFYKCLFFEVPRFTWSLKIYFNIKSKIQDKWQKFLQP